MSKYAKKTDLKKAAAVDTSNLTAKSGLVSLKAEIYKTEIDKLKSVPADLSKLVDN